MAERDSATGGLRADAAQNRARILAVARELFAERGRDVPMDEVARRAGVGIATLYRRFPNREALIEAGLADTMTTFVNAVRETKTAVDARRGFRELIENVRRLQVADRGFSDVMCADAKDFNAEKHRLYADLLIVIERTVAAGALRPDFSPEDFLTIILAHGGILNGIGKDCDTEAISRRFMAAQLLAYADHDAELPPALSAEQVYGTSG